jgi:hypothetical protein
LYLIRGSILNDDPGSILFYDLLFLAVWEQNIYAVPSELDKIKDLKVLMTILDGKIVYQDEKAKLSVMKGTDLIHSS